MERDGGLQYDAIGLRIRARRLALRLTQEKLAERVDISTSFVGHLERGEKIPSVDTLARLCAALDLSLDYLVLGQKQDCNRENCALYADLCDLLATYSGKPR